MIRVLHMYLPRRTVLLCLAELAVISFGFMLAIPLPLTYDDTGLYASGIAKIVIVAAVFALSMYYFDFYDTLVIVSRREILTRLPQVLGFGTLILALLYYLVPSVRLGAVNFVLGLVIVFLLLLLCRETFLVLTRSGALVQRALILGDGTFGQLLAREVRNRPELGLDVVGYVASANCNWSDTTPWLGRPQSLTIIARNAGAHTIIVALQDRRGQLPIDRLLAMKTKGTRIEDGLALYERITGKIPVENLNPGWLLFSPGFRASHTYRFAKQAISVLISGAALLVLAPVMLIAAICIRLTSSGPVLFRQERVGEDGKVFTVLKFRSMRKDAEEHCGPRWASVEDSRVTPVGRVLRRWRIDELPQFLNVLRRDMDLIGPRPERPCFVEQLRRVIPFYDQRHVVKPGITGWAQLKQGYTNSVSGSLEKLQYDLYYINNISLGLDLAIVLLTIKTVLFGRGAH